MRKYTKREKERGLGPLAAFGPRGGAPALGKAKEVADLGREERERGKGWSWCLQLVVMKELDFEKGMKKKLTEVMMMVMLEVKIGMMEVALRW